MSFLQTTVAEGRVELHLDAGAFPRDAVYAAAFTFINRCYVRLNQPAPGRLNIVLRAKAAGSFDAAAVAAELENELLGQSFRQRLADEGRELTASIARGAFGVPQMSGPGAGEGEAPFDDPLGIALSWEEKHAKKSEGEQGT